MATFSLVNTTVGYLGILFVPCIPTIFFRFYLIYTYKIALGWFLSAFGIVQIPLWMAVAIYRQKGVTWMEKIGGAFKPKSFWGPADPQLQKEYLQFLSDKNDTPKNGFFAKFFDRLFGV